MKNILKISILAVFGALLSVGCSPDVIDLPAPDVAPSDLVEGIAFEIVPDAANPNLVRLVSKMDTRYTYLWETPQGRYQGTGIELKMAFPGDYQVTFGVETRGGIVYGEPVTFHIENFYAPFVDDPLWTLLTGGVDQEKTWYLDLNADGQSRGWTGPMYFYGTDDWWGNITDGGDPGDFKINPDSSPDSWNWSPDYPGNSWLMSAGDYGSMTFGLKGAATVKVDHKMISSRGEENGTFLLDVDTKNIIFSDATPLHDSGRDGHVFSWSEVRLISLTEDKLQLGVLRDPTKQAEGWCLLVYNFVSKDYYDNWTPPTKPEPTEPELPEGWLDDVNEITVTTTAIKWVLSDQTPFDWATMGGSLMNGWSSPDDYPDWAGFGPASGNTDESFKNFSLTLDSTNGAAVYVNSEGEETSGTYSVDEKGIYSFDGFDVAVTVGGWFAVETVDGMTEGGTNQWRILKIEKDLAGRVSKLWMGVPNPDKPSEEYKAFCLVPMIG